MKKLACVPLMMFVACSCSPPSGEPLDATFDTSMAEAGDGGCKGTKCIDAPIDNFVPMTCPTPKDVSGFMPETLPDSIGKHSNKCDQAKLDLYHKCVVQSDMAACMTIQQQAMTTFKDCLACLETDVTDAKWGPLVCANAMTCYLNVEGCLNLATNQTGANSCGQLLHSSYGCQREACEEVCSGDFVGFSKCVQTALNGGCKKYGDAFSMTCGTISSDPDGGYPDIDHCFRRQNETDSKGLRVRMDTFFCGP